MVDSVDSVDSADYRSKLANLHRLWWRLHLSETFLSIYRNGMLRFFMLSPSYKNEIIMIFSFIFVLQ